MNKHCFVRQTHWLIQLVSQFHVSVDYLDYNFKSFSLSFDFICINFLGGTQKFLDYTLNLLSNGIWLKLWQFFCESMRMPKIKLEIRILFGAFLVVIQKNRPKASKAEKMFEIWIYSSKWMNKLEFDTKLYIQNEFKPFISNLETI